MPRKGLNRKRGLEALIPQFNETADEIGKDFTKTESITESKTNLEESRVKEKKVPANKTAARTKSSEGRTKPKAAEKSETGRKTNAVSRTGKTSAAETDGRIGKTSAAETDDRTGKTAIVENDSKSDKTTKKGTTFDNGSVSEKNISTKDINISEQDINNEEKEVEEVKKETKALKEKPEDQKQNTAGLTEQEKNTGKTSGQDHNTERMSEQDPNTERTSEYELNTAAGSSQQEGTDDRVMMIRLSQVVPNHEQPRRTFDEDSIAELTESIRQYGVLQPLLVQKKGRYYEIIAGERRWRASRAAGLKEIPCIVREFDRKETMEVSLIENIQRENLNPIEEAEAYRSLTDEFHMTQDEIAGRVGRSRASVANSMRLLKLTPEVRQMVIDNRLSMGHARALLGIEDPLSQTTAAEQVEEKQLSVRETEQLVKKVLTTAEPRKKRVPNEQLRLAYQAAETRIQKKLGTKVSIHSRGKKGKIEIEYYSEEDLDRILNMIG